jgi:hypothetical protein
MAWRVVISLAVCLAVASAGPVRAQGLADRSKELTPQSEAALDRGLQWLHKNQGAEGNWESNDLGLVGMGALAFLSAGHSPGHGKYGETVNRALDYMLKNAKPSGLLNISNSQVRSLIGR